MARLRGDAHAPGTDAQVGLEREAALRRDVGVGVERDVRERVRPARAANPSRRFSSGRSPSSASDLFREVSQKRTVPMFGSSGYCSAQPLPPARAHKGIGRHQP